MLVPLNLYSRRVTLIVVFGEGGIGRGLEFARGVEKLSRAEGVNGSFGSA